MSDFMNGNLTTLKTYMRSVLEKEAEKVCAAKDFKECDSALFDMIQHLHKLREACAETICATEHAKKYQTETKDDNWPLPVELGTEVCIYVDYQFPTESNRFTYYREPVTKRFRLQYTDRYGLEQNVYLADVTRTYTSTWCDVTYLEVTTVDNVTYRFRKEGSCSTWRFISCSRPHPWMADMD